MGQQPLTLTIPPPPDCKVSPAFAAWPGCLKALRDFTGHGESNMVTKQIGKYSSVTDVIFVANKYGIHQPSYKEPPVGLGQSGSHRLHGCVKQGWCYVFQAGAYLFNEVCCSLISWEIFMTATRLYSSSLNALTMSGPHPWSCLCAALLQNM